MFDIMHDKLPYNGVQFEWYNDSQSNSGAVLTMMMRMRRWTSWYDEIAQRLQNLTEYWMILYLVMLNVHCECKFFTFILTLAAQTSLGIGRSVILDGQVSEYNSKWPKSLCLPSSKCQKSLSVYLAVNGYSAPLRAGKGECSKEDRWHFIWRYRCRCKLTL